MNPPTTTRHGAALGPRCDTPYGCAEQGCAGRCTPPEPDPETLDLFGDLLPPERRGRTNANAIAEP